MPAPQGDLRPVVRAGHARRRRSTSPACGSRAVAAWSSAAATWGSRRSRGCSRATATLRWSRPTAHPALVELALEGSIRWERREYRADGSRRLPDRDRRDRRHRRQHQGVRGRRAARDARQRRRRAAAVQLHPAGDRPDRTAGGRDLDRRRVAGAGQADEARDRRAVRRAVRAAGASCSTRRAAGRRRRCRPTRTARSSSSRSSTASPIRWRCCAPATPTRCAS